jgi:competence protein ComEC
VIDLRIVIPASAAWSATIILLPFPGWMLPVAIGGWVAAIGAIALAPVAAGFDATSRFRAVLIVCGISCAAIGMVATAAFATSDSRRPAVLAEARSISSATIVTTQTAVHTSRFFAATITDVDGEAVSVPVLVFGGSPSTRTEIGTSLEISGSLIATAPSDEVSYLVFARGPGREIARPPWYLAWANGLRAGLASASAALPGDGGALLPGLAIGDTVAVSPQLSAAMKASSLSHLTAVSGANCAVVIGLILLVGRALGLGRGLRVAAAFAVLISFVVLVTPQPSVLRSAIMAAIVLGALAGGRPVKGLPVVGVTVLAMLALDPWIAVDYGFALSVLATGGLMALTSPIARRLERFLPRWLALLIAVPLAAQLACQPVLILLNPSLPLYGVLANSLAEPASPVATVLGLVACVALPVLPTVGQVLSAIAWLPSAWIAAVATFFAGLPGARLPWPGGFVGAIALAVTTVLLMVAILSGLPRRARVAIAVAAILLLLVMFVLTILFPGIGVGSAT